jgi:hypothetical protein
MVWYIVLSAAAVITDIIVTGLIFRAIIVHELKVSDQRIDAFREGLEHGERKDSE